MAAEPDFGGYATKAGLRCSDGRVIKAEAFQHMDGKKVPLVYMHGHADMENVLGHGILEARPDGVYVHGYFNETKNGQHAKAAVQHGDLDSLSIYANQLKEQGKIVHSGSIREVSLVLSGANPGAKINYVRIQHSSDPDDVTELEDEAFIHSGESIELPQEKEEASAEEVVVEHAEGDGPTVKDIFEAMSDEEKTVVHYMIGAALDEAEAAASATHSDDTTDAVDGATDETDEGLAHKEGTTEMGRNLFENQGAAGDQAEQHTLSHADMEGIFKQAAKLGSLKEACEQYVDKSLQHGVDNIDILFPDAKNVSGTPEMEKRRTEWVANVLAKVRKTPFSRIKTFAGDLTQDDARAKGYIKGRYKKEEWFGITKRVTTPATIYKKQKLDRDDILDITDFDMVAWLKAEMRLMTEEEVARAILIGDGRDVSDEDKVADPMGASSGAGIRSILNDHELFVTTLNVNVGDANSNYEEVVDAVLDGMEFYKGSGNPTFYTTVRHLNMFKKAKDANLRRYYETTAQVAEALGVSEIVTVEAMQGQEPDCIGIIVNLDDYSTGTDRGGELTMFDDFDIDYNQYKYLMETRLSGALTKPKSALVVMRTGSSDTLLAAPTKPSFVASTGVITIPTVAHVVYKNAAGDTLSAGAQTALTAGESKTVFAYAASGYFFANTVEDSWEFKRPGA